MFLKLFRVLSTFCEELHIWVLHLKLSKILMSQLFLLQLNKIFKQLQLSVLLSRSSRLI